MKLVYVASPYTHKCKQMMSLRAARAAQLTAKLQVKYKDTHHFISPIVHGHSLISTTEGSKLPVDFAFWQRHCIALLSACDEVWVLRIPGWECSVGVREEIKHCTRNKIIVRYVTAEGESV